MKRIITFIAALAFVSGGIISAQEQNGNKYRSRNLYGNIQNSDSALREEVASDSARSAMTCQMTSNPTRRNLEEDSCMEPMRLGSSRSLWELVFATRRSRPAMARR